MKDIELPPLPEPTALGMDFDKGWDGVRAYGYTEDDMASYARAAVEADRAQRVPDGWKPASGMTAHRAAFFMERFKREEKLLGPNEQAAIDFVLALLASTPAPAQQEPSEAEMVCAEAYQVVGCLLSDLGLFETEAARKILDNLSEARMVHQDVLPWESTTQHQEPPQQERKPMTDEERHALFAGLLSETVDTPTEMFRLIVERVERHHGIFAEPAQGIKE